jgi:hypothetical protein
LEESEQSNTFGAANIPREYAHDELQFSSIHANLPQPFVEHPAAYALSRASCLSHNDMESSKHVSLIQQPQLVPGYDNSILDDTHAKIRRVHCISSEKEDLNITSSLNCLGYIEFDFLCDLNSLVKDLFQKSHLQSFNHCSLCAIGKHDSKGDFLVHKVYICSNLKSHFGLHYYDPIGGCTNTNNILQSFPSFSLMKQDQPEEVEHCWLWPCSMAIAPYSNVKASTLAGVLMGMVCHQEGDTMPTMAADQSTPLQQHEYFAMNDYIDNLAARSSTNLTSTYKQHVWKKLARIVLSVCIEGIQISP